MIVRVGHDIAEAPDVQIVLDTDFEFPFRYYEAAQRTAPIWQTVIGLRWRLVAFKPNTDRAKFKPERSWRDIEADPDGPCT